MSKAHPRAPGRPDLVTFDCYGTLIDWREGIATAFRDAIPASSDVDERRLFAAYAAAEAEVEQEPYRPYRQVLAEAAVRAAELLQVNLPGGSGSFLAEPLPSWIPFQDTNPALERLSSLGIRLGILSNVDEDLLASTLNHFTVRFDLIITAERVRSYKPKPAHFLALLEAVGGPERLLHAAESYYHDILPAQPLGIPTIWLNRTSATPSGSVLPTVELSDLAEAVDWIANFQQVA